MNADSNSDNASKIDRELGEYLDSAPRPEGNAESVGAGVFLRLADRTFGYIVASMAGLYILHLIPRFSMLYSDFVYSSVHTGEFNRIIHDDLSTITFQFFLSLAFFIGGNALQNSLKWGRNLVAYLFILSGLMALNDSLYLVKNGWFDSVCNYRGYTKIFGTDEKITGLAFITLIALAYLTYMKKTVSLVRIMALLNILFTLINIYFIAGLFINLPGAFSAIYLMKEFHFLALMFSAAILLQIWNNGMEFIPALKSFSDKAAN